MCIFNPHSTPLCDFTIHLLQHPSMHLCHFTNRSTLLRPSVYAPVSAPSMPLCLLLLCPCGPSLWPWGLSLFVRSCGEESEMNQEKDEVGPTAPPHHSLGQNPGPGPRQFTEAVSIILLPPGRGMEEGGGGEEGTHKREQEGSSR